MSEQKKMTRFEKINATLTAVMVFLLAWLLIFDAGGCRMTMRIDSTEWMGDEPFHEATDEILKIDELVEVDE